MFENWERNLESDIKKKKKERGIWKLIQILKGVVLKKKSQIVNSTKKIFKTQGVLRINKMN